MTGKVRLEHATFPILYVICFSLQSSPEQNTHGNTQIEQQQSEGKFWPKGRPIKTVYIGK